MDVSFDRRPMHLSACPQGGVLWWADDWWQRTPDGFAPLATDGSPDAWSAPVDVGPELVTAGAAALRASAHKPIVLASTTRGPLLFLTEGHGATVARELRGARSLGAAPSAGAAGGLPAPPVAFRYVAHPYGASGVEKSTQEVHDGILEDRLSRIVIEWTRQILADADTGARGYPDNEKIVQALFAAQKKVIKFLDDPRGAEFIPPASAMLCKDPRGLCLKAEDCDGQIRFLGACCSSVGIPLKLRVRYYEGEGEAHITLMYEVRHWQQKDRREWRCIDPSMESGRCYGGPFKKEWTMDIAPTSPTFVALGAAPAAAAAPSSSTLSYTRAIDVAGGSTLGDPPPAGVISEAQNGAFFQQLADCKGDVDRAHANLQRTSDGYRAVRKDLGLPQFDPAPGGLENPPSGSPLADYLKTGAWTQGAENQEQKMLQALAYMSGWIGDAISSGARQVYWNSGDLWIASQPGDPFFVLMRPNDKGTLVPQYVDPTTNQPTGTLGLAPAVIIALAAIGAVTTMATCYAVVKTAEYLSGAHHDDGVVKINEQIQENIKSGKATPEQEAALLKAQQDMHAAQPAPPATRLFDFLESVPMLIFLVLAGLAGGIALTKGYEHYAAKKKPAAPAKRAAPAKALPAAKPAAV